MRKRLLHIICLVSTILLFSCSRDATDELPALTRAQLSINLVNNGEVDQQEEINSMRFIVFGSTPSGVRLDVNKHILLSTPGTATDIDAQLLEVTYCQRTTESHEQTQWYCQSLGVTRYGL